MNTGKGLDPLSPDARRNILVAALEEDPIPDVLRNLMQDFGGDEVSWLKILQSEVMLGTIKAFEHVNLATAFRIIPNLEKLSKRRRRDYGNAVYLMRTNATLPLILSLPPPPVGDSQWVIGLWGRQPDA